MMVLGRRGIGSGCASSSCAPKDERSLDELRQRQAELAGQIRELEATPLPPKL